MKKLLILLIGLYLGGCHQTPPSKTGLEGKPLPSFDFLLLDSSTYVNSTKLSADKPIVFFYFSPHCPYCRALTHEIVNRDKVLKEIQFVLLTPSSISEVTKFYNYYKLEKYKNIITAFDYKNSFANHFKTTQVPFLLIYNKQRILKLLHLGTMPTSEIKSYALSK